MICSLWLNSILAILKTAQLRTGLIVCSAIFLGACASTFKAETTVFHRWPNHTSSLPGLKFAPATGAEQSLEREAYLQVIRQAMASKGFTEGAEGRILVSFTYTSQESPRLIAGDPWFTPSIWAGGVFRSGGVMLGGSIPVGAHPPREMMYFDRTLSLVLTETIGDESKRVYEGKAKSLDTGRNALAALPYLVRALLDDFPGPSGATRQVTLPLSR
jgi:hypothetical protein